MLNLEHEPTLICRNGLHQLSDRTTASPNLINYYYKDNSEKSQTRHNPPLGRIFRIISFKTEIPRRSDRSKAGKKVVKWMWGGANRPTS